MSASWRRDCGEAVGTIAAGLGVDCWGLHEAIVGVQGWGTPQNVYSVIADSLSFITMSD